jgi:hypothetical protein
LAKRRKGRPKQRTPARARKPKPAKPVNPLAITPAGLADALAKSSGQPITAAMIAADVAAGAPANADGTLNLVHYAAWLVKQAAV